MSETLRATGLAALVAGAARDPAGHLILADWLEEHLQRADVAAVLRASQDDPRPEKDLRYVGFTDFRHQLLDAEVMLYLTRWTLWTPWHAGQKHNEPATGHLVGLYTSATSSVGPQRWTRWVLSAPLVPEMHVLWTQLGEGVPERTNS